MARVLHWNGKDVPPELRELPAGDYVLEEPGDLSPEEEEGIRRGLEQIERGEVARAEEVHAEIADRLKKR